MVLKPGYIWWCWFNGLGDGAQDTYLFPRLSRWFYKTRELFYRVQHIIFVASVYTDAKVPGSPVWVLDSIAFALNLVKVAQMWAPRYSIWFGRQTWHISLLPTEPQSLPHIPSQGLRSLVSIFTLLNSQNPRKWYHLIYFQSQALNLTPSLGDATFHGSKLIYS